MNKATIDFLEELKSDQNVIGIVLFGSWARGNNREESDVDLLVLLQEGFKRAIKVSDGQVFELIYTTPDDALKFYSDHLDDAFGLWSVAKNLYSKDSSVENLQRLVNEMLGKGKLAISSIQREQTLFDTQDKLKYVKSTYTKDTSTSNLMLFNAAFELTEVFFDLRQEWTPAPKQRLSRISEIDTRFFELLGNFYEEETTTQQRWKLLEEMTALVFK